MSASQQVVRSSGTEANPTCWSTYDYVVTTTHCRLSLCKTAEGRYFLCRVRQKTFKMWVKTFSHPNVMWQIIFPAIQPTGAKLNQTNSQCNNNTSQQTHNNMVWWLNSRAPDSWSEGRRFDPRSMRYHVTTLGKLFTCTCLCPPSSISWYQL